MGTTHHFLSFLWPLLKGLVVIYAVLFGTTYLLQRKLQYFPNADPVPLPRGEEFRGLQAVELVSEDGNRLLSWYWPGERPLTLVYFGGNGGNRADRLDWARDFRRLGYGLLLVDYRGYGGNPGTPTETGLYRDAQAALDWLFREPDRKLAYFGESLGSGVAVEMATRATPAGLIIQSGFSSAVDVGRSRFPFLPVGVLMKDRYDSLPKIRGLRCPCWPFTATGTGRSPSPWAGRSLRRPGSPRNGCWFPVPPITTCPVSGGNPTGRRSMTFC